MSAAIHDETRFHREGTLSTSGNKETIDKSASGTTNLPADQRTGTQEVPCHAILLHPPVLLCQKHSNYSERSVDGARTTWASEPQLAIAPPKVKTAILDDLIGKKHQKPDRWTGRLRNPFNALH